MPFEKCDFEFGERSLIGDGAFGQVYKAVHKFEKEDGNKKAFALKRIAIPVFKDLISHGSTSVLSTGADLHKKLLAEVPTANKVCPNIIKYYGYFPHGDMLTKACDRAILSKGFSGPVRLVPDEDCFFVVMELCDNNLDEFLNKNGVSRATLHDLFGQILTGLDFIHRRARIHRDVRPENILIKKESGGILVAKLGDFGLSKDISLQDNESLSYVGNNFYRSPEMKRSAEERGGRSLYDSSADIYSCGLSFYKCMFAFDNTDKWKMAYLLEICQGTHEFTYFPTYNKEVRLVKEMTTQDPSERPTAAQLLSRVFKQTLESGMKFELCEDWDLTSWEFEITLEGQANREAIMETLGSERHKDLPLVVVSVNGPARTYKSFLVANMIKYLRYCKQPKWIFKGNRSSVAWIGGTNPVTKTVNMWLEPFVVLSGDQEFLVLLLDTPGITKYNPRDRNSFKKFALSLFLSSVFIYNVKGSLDALESLASLLEPLGALQSLHACEKLVVLHRDWALDQIDGDHVSYLCGYYDDTLSPPSQRTNWKHTLFCGSLHSADLVASKFGNVGVYAMAHPGESWMVPKPGSHPSDWDPNFITSLEDFMDKVMHPDVLARSIKRHSNGEVLKASEFIGVLTRLEQMFAEL